MASLLLFATGSKSVAIQGPTPVTQWGDGKLPTPQAAPLFIEQHLVRTGFERATGRTIDTIVLHSCYNPRTGNPYSVEAILAIFSRERVASHYLIDREGRIYQLVSEDNIAYHAGRSEWQDRSNINRFSLGIELINSTEERYTEAQYRSLDVLLQDIDRRRTIRFLVAHGEIASQRRSDPWNFDWARVASFRNRSQKSAETASATSVPQSPRGGHESIR